MPVRPILARALIILSLGALPSTIMAALAPGETHLDFTVLKNGSAIGHHRIDLVRNGDSETVSIKTNVLVTVAYVPVYRFEHTGSEVWRNGHLISLQSQTNDDGDKHVLAVTAKDDHIEVTGDGATNAASAGIIPASLWNRDLVSQTVLLNTLTGKQMTVNIADLGEDSIRSHGVPLQAHHYKMTGDLQRELWYDQTGTLALVKFKAKDDSDILYVLE